MRSKSLLTKVKELLESFITILLLMITVTFVFIFSVMGDVGVLWVIHLAFGGAITQISSAQKVLDVIKYLSTFATIVAYTLTLLFLLYLSLKDFFRTSWEIKKEKTVPLTSTIVKWLYYTGNALLIIIAATAIFVSFIGIVVLALWITNLIVGPLLVNVVELITTFVVAGGYLITLASSLCKYGKDLLDMSRETK